MMTQGWLWDSQTLGKKNHTYVKVGHTSGFLFGIY